MTSYPRYLVIDLGSTTIKAHVFSSDGLPIAQADANTPTTLRSCAELHPDKLWTTVIEVMRQVLDKTAKRQEIRAITVIGMAATYIPLDCNAHPVSGAIMWYDPAGGEEVSKFLHGGDEVTCLRNSLGQYPMPMYLPFRISWLKQAASNALEHVRWWANVTDYITMRLIGSSTPISDYSIASRTMLLDHNQREWNDNALAYWGIAKETLPRLVQAGSVVGSLKKAVADELGLSPSTKIVLGAHDHMCTALGCGLTDPSAILNSSGSSEAIVQLSSEQCAYTNATAHFLNIEEYLIPAVKALVGYVAPSGVILLPWFEAGIQDQLIPEQLFEYDGFFEPPGIRMITDLPGRLVLKGTDFSPSRIFTAIAMGICFEIKKICHDMQAIGLPKPYRMRVAGGLSRSKFLNQMKADIMGYEVEVANEPQLSALGGCVLAGYGTGDFANMSDRCSEMYKRLSKETFYPNSSRYSLYNDIYRTYEGGHVN